MIHVGHPVGVLLRDLPAPHSGWTGQEDVVQFVRLLIVELRGGHLPHEDQALALPPPVQTVAHLYEIATEFVRVGFLHPVCLKECFPVLLRLRPRARLG